MFLLLKRTHWRLNLISALCGFVLPSPYNNDPDIKSTLVIKNTVLKRFCLWRVHPKSPESHFCFVFLYFAVFITLLLLERGHLVSPSALVITVLPSCHFYYELVVSCIMFICPFVWFSGCLVFLSVWLVFFTSLCLPKQPRTLFIYSCLLLLKEMFALLRTTCNCRYP